MTAGLVGFHHGQLIIDLGDLVLGGAKQIAWSAGWEWDTSGVGPPPFRRRHAGQSALAVSPRISPNASSAVLIALSTAATSWTVAYSSQSAGMASMASPVVAPWLIRPDGSEAQRLPHAASLLARGANPLRNRIRKELDGHRQIPLEPRRVFGQVRVQETLPRSPQHLGHVDYVVIGSSRFQMPLPFTTTRFGDRSRSHPARERLRG